MASKPPKSGTTRLDVGSAGDNTPLSKGDKREATSPLDVGDTDSKKIRHHSGVGDTILMDDDVNDGTSSTGDTSLVHVLSQPINPLDIVNIAAELRSLMLPELANIIKGQLPDIKAIVKESTDTLSTEIQALRAENTNLHAENVRLRADVESLSTRVARVESENDALEQYTRRNSIRISGIPETDSENTDEIVFKIADKLNVHIGSSDIDRSHRIGNPKTGGRHRDIIVKFATYNARQRIYHKRVELRNSEDKDTKSIFINEDLTKKRSKLLFDARTLSRVGKLKSAHSSDGKIFVRDNSDDRYLIKSDADILKFGDPEEAKKTLTERAKARGYVPMATT